MPGLDCREFAGGLTELARRGPLTRKERERLAAHIDECRLCRKTFEGQVRLSAAAGELSTQAAQFNAPPSVEHAVLAAFESSSRFRRRRFVGSVVGVAVAASLAVLWIVHRPGPRGTVIGKTPTAVVATMDVSQAPPKVATTKRRRRAARPAPEPEQPFIAIPYTMPLEPYERADVMRMDLPVSALIAAGVPMRMADPTANARADVLVGQDGRPRAIRLISISTSN